MSSSSPTTSSSPIFPSFPISCSFSHFPSFPISCSFFMHIPSPYAEALLQPSLASMPIPLCPSLPPSVRPCLPLSVPIHLLSGLKTVLFPSFFKKNPKILAQSKKSPYLCTRISTETELQTSKLGYGVMVTLQILVLSFLVRVRVPQQQKSPSA